MNITKVFIVAIILVASLSLKAQVKDSSINIWQCEINYSFDFPLQDMKTNYGKNSTIGVGLSFKTKHNWVAGFEASYLWGGHVKDTSSILSNLMTSSGNIINKYGEAGTIWMTESGFYAGFKIGRVFAFKKPNPNSGIVLNFGVGLLQHHVRIDNRSNNTPPVLGDYKKGYDKLRNGLAVRGFLGYQFISNNRLVNFYAGVEFSEAWTMSRRSYDFNLHGKDETKYNDGLLGIRVGWILPIYRRNPHEFYYY